MFGLFTKSENKRLDAVRERAKKLADKPKPPATKATAKATKRKAAAKATAKKTSGGSYKIKSGDTLSQIAKSKGITLKSLMAANPSIKNANRIRVGQSIKIPSGDKSSNPYKGMTSSEMKGLDSQKQQTKTGTKSPSIDSKENTDKRARSATRNANMRSATEKNRKLVRKTVTKKKAK
mgnify:CR=1 FL=1